MEITSSWVHYINVVYNSPQNWWSRKWVKLAGASDFSLLMATLFAQEYNLLERNRFFALAVCLSDALDV